MMSRKEKSKKMVKKIEKEEKLEKTHKRIGIFLKIFFTIIIICVALFAYMNNFGTKGLKVREYKIENDSIPNNFHGFKIVHFSDLHYLTTIKQKELTKLVNKINELKPDIIVFTGDLIDKDKKATQEELDTLTNSLNKLTATTGMYAVKGNHDYHSDNFEKVLNKTNFKILDNSYEYIYYHGTTPIVVVGTGSNLQNDFNIGESYSYDELDNIYTVSLLHEPDSINEIISTNMVNLALAGHSHNGQVRLPWFGAIKKVKGATTYYDNHYSINDTELYISSGLGTSGIPIRFFNKPSINLYRLISKEA